MKNKDLEKIVFSAMFLALSIILPFFTSQVKEIGDSFLPMHIPVMLCGLICGAQYGLMVGFLSPIVRALVFSMPPLYPTAVWMSLELATYGFVLGLLYGKLKNKKTGYLYLCLIISMLCGRIVWGITKAILLGLGDSPFTLKAFISGGFLDAFPGIILQLILIPFIMGVVNHTKKSANKNNNG